MAVAIGTVDKFELEGTDIDDWNAWTEILDEYFNSNGIKNEDAEDKAKRRSVFISNVGKPTYMLIKKLVAPEAIANKTLQDMIDAVGAHLNPTPKAIVARYHF